MTSMLVRIIAAAVLVAGSLSVAAQTGSRTYRIGFVGSGSAAGPGIEAFRQGLRQLGYVEGKNIIIEARFGHGQSDRLGDQIADVIKLNLDVLVVGSTPAALAARRATASVPIVFASLFDPVGSGVVTSLARPAGNVTGVSIGVGGSGLAEKWLELLKDTVPAISHVAVLSNSSNPAGMASVREIEAAARALRVKVDVLSASSAAALERAFETIVARGAHGIIVTNDPFFTLNQARLVEFAAEKRLPAMYFFRLFADAGGLMAYGARPEDSFRRAAIYVDRILKGAKPGDLAIEQPTRFELVINLKTAKLLGLTIPPSVLLRADSIIQ